MDFLGDNHTSDINPFFRKDVQHDKKDISGYLNNIFNFVSQSFDSFMVELAKEYPKKIYLHNRYNKLKGWQTKMNNASDCNYAVAYIETSDDISTMPEEININGNSLLSIATGSCACIRFLKSRNTQNACCFF